MDTQEFIKRLNDIQKLIEKENYKEAINLIEKLKKIEQKSYFDYNLSHKLYQLDSNLHSLYNQQIIIENVRDLSKKHKTISFQKLNQIIRDKNEISLNNDILRREIELLILKNQLPWRIEKDIIILKSS